MSCVVGRRLGSDLALLGLWHGPVATAPIKPQTWEPPCAVGAALEKGKKKIKKYLAKYLHISLTGTHNTEFNGNGWINLKNFIS